MSDVDPLTLVTRRSGTVATRRRIANAALELFSTRGYTATTLQTIADTAGLHVQTIYQAFGSKTAVLAAACELARARSTTTPKRYPPNGRGCRRSWPILIPPGR